MITPDQFLRLDSKIEESQLAEQMVATPDYLSRLIKASEISEIIASNWIGMKITGENYPPKSWLQRFPIFQRIRSLLVVGSKIKEQGVSDEQFVKIKEALYLNLADTREASRFNINHFLLSASTADDYNQKVEQLILVLQSPSLLSSEFFMEFVTEISSVYLAITHINVPSMDLQQAWLRNITAESFNELMSIGKDSGIYEFIEKVDHLQRQVVSLANFFESKKVGYFFIIELGTWAHVDAGETKATCILKGVKVSLPNLKGLTGLPEVALSGTPGYTTWVNKLTTLSKISSIQKSIFPNNVAAHVVTGGKSIALFFDIMCSGSIGKTGQLWVQQLDFPSNEEWNALYEETLRTPEEEFAEHLRAYHLDHNKSKVPYSYLRSDGIGFHEHGLMGTYMPRGAYINPYDTSPIFFLDLSEEEVEAHVQQVPDKANVIRHRRTYVMKDVTLADERLKYVWVTGELRNLLLQYFNNIGPEETALVLGKKDPNDLFVSSGFDIHE